MSEIMTYQAASLTERTKYAQTLAAAGDLIPKGLRGDNGQPSPGKILLVMETGAMLGLNPMAALQGIDVIEGRATISPQMMSGLVRRAGHKIEIQQAGSIGRGDFMVKVTLSRGDDGTVYESVWDPQRAVRAGLCEYKKAGDVWQVHATSKYGKALPWQAHPETMCKWRAVGEVCREGADDVLKGIAYTREEIESEMSVMSDPEPEPTEDWAAQMDAADTVADLEAVGGRLKEKNEGTDALRLQFAARLGVLKAESEVVDAEIVEEGEDESPDAATTE